MKGILFIKCIILTFSSIQSFESNLTQVAHVTNSPSNVKEMQDVHFENPTKVLSRRKRFIVFPEGSSFSVRNF